MRHNLYMLRHSKKFTQAQMADKIGCTRCTYAAIEKGTRNGREAFWKDLKKAFDLLDYEIAKFKKLDTE